MTAELLLEDALRIRHERADPALKAGITDRDALVRALESLRTTVQVDDARAAARLSMRQHGKLMRAGRGAEADKAASEAESTSDPVRTPDVELELAARAAAIGSTEDAERRYRGLLTVLGDESALGAVAAFRLAHLRIERGARDEAITLWERALRGADENLRPHVLVELADALRSRGRRDQVECLYAQAIATDHPELAPQAALTLGGLREEAGDNKAALELYALVAASKHPDHASDAEARHGALMYGRTRRAIEQMLLVELKDGRDALPDEEPPTQECANERGSQTRLSALPGWCRRPPVDPELSRDLGQRRLPSYERLLSRFLARDGAPGLLATIGSQYLPTPEPASDLPSTVGSRVADSSPTADGNRSLDCVVILGDAAASVGSGAHPDRDIAFVCVNGLRSFETAQDGLHNVAEGIRGVRIDLGVLANFSMDIETARNLADRRLFADQQSLWEAVLTSENVGPERQPDTFIEGQAIGLAFGNTSAPSRDTGAQNAASSDHLLLSHITHSLTALHCKEALITGSLIGMSGSRWSDAMQGLDPGLARWRAVSEGVATTCRCQSTTLQPGRTVSRRALS